MRQLDPGLGTEPSSGEGQKTSKGEGGVPECRLAAVPETSPDRVDSVVDRAARTSESRDLALSVEQEIYLKDTQPGPIQISWHFEWLKEWQLNTLPLLTQPLYQRHRSISIFSFLL